MKYSTDISESILDSVKKLIGIHPDDTSFDLDIIFQINSAIFTLVQLGVLTKGYTVMSKDDTYADVFGELEDHVVNQAKIYLVMKTKLGFDSPTLTTVMQALKEQIAEAEWRLNVAIGPPYKDEIGGEIQND